VPFIKDHIDLKDSLKRKSGKNVSPIKASTEKRLKVMWKTRINRINVHKMMKSIGKANGIY